MPRFRSNIRAISLDLDDTLWPVGPTIVRAEHRAQAALTSPLAMLVKSQMGSQQENRYVRI